jgi:hypothetical protein
MGVKKSDDRETEEREMTKQKMKYKIGRYKYKIGNRKQDKSIHTR